MKLTSKLGIQTEGVLVFLYDGKYYSSVEYKIKDTVRRPYELLIGIMQSKENNNELYNNVKLKEVGEIFKNYTVLTKEEYVR